MRKWFNAAEVWLWAVLLLDSLVHNNGVAATICMVFFIWTLCEKMENPDDRNKGR